MTLEWSAPSVALLQAYFVGVVVGAVIVRFKLLSLSMNLKLKRKQLPLSPASFPLEQNSDSADSTFVQFSAEQHENLISGQASAGSSTKSHGSNNGVDKSRAIEFATAGAIRDISITYAQVVEKQRCSATVISLANERKKRTELKLNNKFTAEAQPLPIEEINRLIELYRREKRETFDLYSDLLPGASTLYEKGELKAPYEKDKLKAVKKDPATELKMSRKVKSLNLEPRVLETAVFEQVNKEPVDSEH